jgi:hypothetical protein
MANDTQKVTASTQNDDETPRERFVRLAGRRVSAAQEIVGKIGLLANTGPYEYTDDDTDKIEKALQESVRVSIAALRAKKVPRSSGFSL